MQYPIAVAVEIAMNAPHLLHCTLALAVPVPVVVLAAPKPEQPQ
jgi:hypothetical protein